MENKVKEWIEAEYNAVKRVLESTRPHFYYVRNELVNNSIERSYGVMMFAVNNLFDSYNEELGKWWYYEMLPKYEELKKKALDK